MSDQGLVYSPRPAATGASEMEVLAAVYAFVLECQEKKVTRVSDGHEGDEERGSASVG